LQEELSEKLGAAVSIQHSAKGAGKLIFKYNSVDELDGILAHLK
jgi:ParB family chromosome partitioning protein